jgi:hypothetical protein
VESEVLTPIVTDHVDVLVTTLGNMAELCGIGCGRYSARQIVAGEIGTWTTMTCAGSPAGSPAIQDRIIAVTIRHADSSERLLGAAAVHADGTFFRSPSTPSLWDRLGGGDV